MCHKVLSHIPNVTHIIIVMVLTNTLGLQLGVTGQKVAPLVIITALMVMYSITLIWNQQSLALPLIDVTLTYWESKK